MPRIDRRARALEDLAGQADYIARDNLDAAMRFLDSAEEAFNLLAENPGAGAQREYLNPHLAGIRMWPINGFEKHLIFYRELTGGIEVVRVLHASRDLDSELGKEAY